MGGVVGRDVYHVCVGLHSVVIYEHSHTGRHTALWLFMTILTQAGTQPRRTARPTLRCRSQ